jgi:hypothetical protein
MSAERRYRDADRHEARDEIVRLRAELDLVRMSYVSECGARIAAAAERDRLRDAFRQGQEDMRRRSVEVAQARVHNATEWDSSRFDQAAENISLAIAALKVGDTA